ncbi:MAG: hypothetical protein ACRCSK_01330, partial [Fusobacteriaceae bacterium]
MATSDINFSVGDKVKISTRIYEGKGEIEKYLNKNPRQKSYVLIPMTEDGYYEVSGTISKIYDKKYFKEYEISEIEKISKIEKNLPEKLLEARADKILKNSSYAQKNLFKGVV